MMRLAWTLALLLGVACGGPTATSPKPAPVRPDIEDPPAFNPSAEPFFAAARQVCRLVHRRDDSVIAVAFVPTFFDTTPPEKLAAALYEVHGGLGECSERMVVVKRASALEGEVAVECEHGVLLLSMGLDTAPHRPIAALGLELRPGSTIKDVQGSAAPK